METTNLISTSDDATFAAVKGETRAPGGFGVWGTCDTGHGVHGDSISSQGVVGTSQTMNGVHGISKGTGTGVLGESTDGPGVWGNSINGRGVEARSTTNYAIRAHSDGLPGIRASSTNARAIEGWAVKDDGVWGISELASGVHGISKHNGTGVVGESGVGIGVQGTGGPSGTGVFGTSELGTGIAGASVTGIGLHARGGNLAGLFDGKVWVVGDMEVTGDIKLTNADFAEEFDVAAQSEPGEVMVLTESGILQPSTIAYDKKVVGIISGAGSYKPGITLDKQIDNAGRKPIALMGKVYCKVDAETSPIEIGDMLTTSDIPGHAMKAIDSFKAFGAVIGKSLGSLNQGKGLIPVLVVLQ